MLHLVPSVSYVSKTRCCKRSAVTSAALAKAEDTQVAGTYLWPGDQGMGGRRWVYLVMAGMGCVLDNIVDSASNGVDLLPNAR